jgi:hypothetical protein
MGNKFYTTSESAKIDLQVFSSALDFILPKITVEPNNRVDHQVAFLFSKLWCRGFLPHVQ